MDTASKLNNATHFLSFSRKLFHCFWYLPDASWHINTSVKKNIR